MGKINNDDIFISWHVLREGIETPVVSDSNIQF